MEHQDLGKIRILYVEDDQDIREEIGQFLEMEAQEVLYAANGKEGLKVFKEHAPDIIISDIRMPVMDGLEMSAKIKKEKRDQMILVMTAFNDAEHLYKAIEIGVDHYVTKPVDLDILETKLDDMVHVILRHRELEQTRHLLEQYRAAVDMSAIFSKSDLTGRITYANDKLCEITGYTREELLGKGHNIFRHPHVPKEIYESMWETIQKKQPWSGVIKNQAKNGESYYVKAHIFPILDVNNEVVEYISIRHDITEQEEYREILEEQLDVSLEGLGNKIHAIKEYEKAIDAGTAFVRLDTEGYILTANRAFCELVGSGPKGLNGKHYTDLCSSGNQYDICAHRLKVLSKKEIMHDIVQLKTESGAIKHFSVAFIPIVNIQDTVLEVMAIHYDITEVIKLNQEIEKTQKEVVFTMGAIGESRSKETGNHVKRVAEYSYVFAKTIGLSEKEADLIRQASPMHDIGKVGIPDAILNKPGRLDEKEWKIMKTHARLGYNMLKHSSRPLLQTAATIAHTHHERWDGQGYPAGLAGENIPIVGRITAIADIFDALGSDRCYKKAWSDESIFQYYREEGGKIFDPKLVDVFFKHLDVFLKIRNHFKDMV